MPNPEEIKKSFLQINNYLQKLEEEYNSAPKHIKAAGRSLGFNDVFKYTKDINEIMNTPGFENLIESDPDSYSKGITTIEENLAYISRDLVDAHYAFKRFSEGNMTAANTHAKGPEYTDEIPDFEKVFKLLEPLKESLPKLSEDVMEHTQDFGKKKYQFDYKKYVQSLGITREPTVQLLQKQMAENEKKLKNIRSTFNFENYTKQIDYKKLNLNEQYKSQLQQLKDVQGTLNDFLYRFSSEIQISDDRPLNHITTSRVRESFYAFIDAIDEANNIPDSDVEGLKKARVKILDIGNNFYSRFDKFIGFVAKVAVKPVNENKVDKNGVEDRTVVEAFFMEVCDSHLMRIQNMINNVEILASKVLSKKLGENFDMEPKDFDHDDYELPDEHDILFKYHREYSNKLKGIEMNEPDNMQEEDPNEMQQENLDERQEENLDERQEENLDEMQEEDPNEMQQENSDDRQEENSDERQEEMKDENPEEIYEENLDERQEEMKDENPEKINEENPNEMRQENPDERQEEMKDENPEKINEENPNEMQEENGNIQPAVEEGNQPAVEEGNQPAVEEQNLQPVINEEDQKETEVKETAAENQNPQPVNTEEVQPVVEEPHNQPESDEPFNVRAEKARNSISYRALYDGTFALFRRVDNVISKDSINFLLPQIPDSLYKEALLSILPNDGVTYKKYQGLLTSAVKFEKNSDNQFFEHISNIKRMLLDDRKNIINLLGLVSALAEKDTSLQKVTVDTLKRRIESTIKNFNEELNKDLSTFAPDIKPLTEKEIQTAKDNFISTIGLRQQEIDAQKKEMNEPEENVQELHEENPDESIAVEDGQNLQPQENEVDNNNVVDTSSNHEEPQMNAEPTREEREAAMQHDITLIREKFKKCAKEMEKALSPWKNSEEYKKLISVVQAVGDGKPQPEYSGLSPVDQFTQELYKIYDLTEKYLAHKAKDGVNKNAYMKLCVVEETSRLIESSLQITGERRLEHNMSTMEQGLATDLPHVTSAMKVSLESRKGFLSDEIKAMIPELTEPACKNRIDAYKAANPKKTANVEDAKIGRVIRDVDNSMCKILLKATDPQAGISKSSVKSLLAMRKTFLEKPFPPMVEEPELAVRNEEVSNNGPRI